MSCAAVFALGGGVGCLRRRGAAAGSCNTAARGLSATVPPAATSASGASVAAARHPRHAPGQAQRPPGQSGPQNRRRADGGQSRNMRAPRSERLYMRIPLSRQSAATGHIAPVKAAVPSQAESSACKSAPQTNAACESRKPRFSISTKHAARRPLDPICSNRQDMQIKAERRRYQAGFTASPICCFKKLFGM